jgi:phosphoglycolate phosphatase
MIGKYKHIIWDWNGTLLNDVDLCVDIINRILSKRGLRVLSHSDYKNIFTFPVKDYYSSAGLDFSKDTFEDLGTEWMDEYQRRRDESCLYEGVTDILSYVQENGTKQSILSAYMQNTLEEIIAMLGLSKYFAHISGLDHIYAHGKIETGKELIAIIGLEKSEMVLIGDTIHDYEVARTIGAECILIANGHQSKERLLTCGVPVLESITALKNI